MIADQVREFREEYRRNRVPWFYCGEAHLLFTAGVLIGTIAWHLWRVEGLRRLELAIVPATLLFGNWVEYMVHRYPLHDSYRLFKPLYHIHSGQHHRFYVSGAMDFESFRDFIMVLFPPWAPVLVAGFATVTGSYAIGPLFSENAGHLFAAAGTSCLLLYEMLHGLSHCPDEGWAGKLPFIQGIRRHHRLHHDPALMSRYNFNITFPFSDWIYGTSIAGAPRGAPPPVREAVSR